MVINFKSDVRTNVILEKLIAFRLGVENLGVNAQLDPYTFQLALDKFMYQFNHEYTESMNGVTVSIYEEPREIQLDNQCEPKFDDSFPAGHNALEFV